MNATGLLPPPDPAATRAWLEERIATYKERLALATCNCGQFNWNGGDDQFHRRWCSFRKTAELVEGWERG